MWVVPLSNETYAICDLSGLYTLVWCFIWKWNGVHKAVHGVPKWCAERHKAAEGNMSITDYIRRYMVICNTVFVKLSKMIKLTAPFTFVNDVVTKLCVTPSSVVQTWYSIMIWLCGFGHKRTFSLQWAWLGYIYPASGNLVCNEGECVSPYSPCQSLAQFMGNSTDHWCQKQKITVVTTLRPRQNGRHLPDDIFKCMFLPIYNILALVQIMAWCWQATSRCFKPWWLVYWPIYASLGLNGFIKFADPL